MSFARTGLIVLGVALLAVPPATAQDTSMVFVEEQESDSLAMAMAQMGMFMGPMMGAMMENMVEGLLTVLAKPGSAERLATFTRNYYDALRRKGFTEDQALRLVAAVGFPSVGMMGN